MVRLSSSKSTSPSINFRRSLRIFFSSLALPISLSLHHLISLSYFLQKHLGTDGIEDTAFATFGHNLGCFFRCQPPELHIFDHLSNEVEGDHAMAAHGIKF